MGHTDKTHRPVELKQDLTSSILIASTKTIMPFMSETKCDGTARQYGYITACELRNKPDRRSY